jgi:hypothetical protein
MRRGRGARTEPEVCVGHVVGLVHEDVERGPAGGVARGGERPLGERADLVVVRGLNVEDEDEGGEVRERRLALDVGGCRRAGAVPDLERDERAGPFEQGPREGRRLSHS